MENMFSSSASEALIETLIKRGWSFGDLQHVRGLIIIHSALEEDPFTADLLESLLANMDLRTIGGKSLPESSVLRKSSHIQGPKVLQVSSLKDISRSSVTDSSGNAHDHRMLRLSLTDGHSEITAIEYSHITSLDDVVPGAKVRLENKAPVNNGIVCLSPNVITVLGGVIKSLYEEWQANKKYSELSRSFLKPSKSDDIDGPPSFEKLQPRPPQHRSRHDNYPLSTSRLHQNTSAERWAKPDSRHMPGIYSTEHIADGKSASNVGRLEEKPSSSDTRQKEVVAEIWGKPDSRHMPVIYSIVHIADGKSASNVGRHEEKPSSSDTRQKEVVESIPVQNQAAAQKLLQKMNQSGHENHHYRGRRRGGRERHDDSPVFTLDEWERQRDGGQTSRREDSPSLYREQQRDGGQTSRREDFPSLYRERQRDGGQTSRKEDFPSLSREQQRDGGQTSRKEDFPSLSREQQRDGGQTSRREDFPSLYRERQRDGGQISRREDFPSLYRERQRDGGQTSRREDFPSLSREQQRDGGQTSRREDFPSLYQEQQRDGGQTSRRDDFPSLYGEQQRDQGQTSRREDFPSADRNENFARRLQMQYDLEDGHELRGSSINNSQAENIKMSMFNYDRNDQAYQGEGFRGRGGKGGRGRGGKGGRGRGRGGSFY